ncbi:26S protease regulatory subunit [Altererythrobacter sp. FM1]|uniref:ATP-binding protein n=1 Tax=Tsuneonella flava TaxID=2055955 RepID=UPI000C80FE90|nr:AAA family ATPase [Tsuneonella flava]ROT93302.1 26S protease regulatory subunit [Altererythrobacter sp. FM1]
MKPQPEDERKGDLMRVTYVDEDAGAVFLRLKDGRTAWITGIAAGSLEKNDTILSCDGEWFRVPSEVWPTSHLTSVIREVLEDGTILGESGSALLTLSNPNALTINQNSTVEIDESSAILRVLSKDSIRVRQHPADEETSAASFLVRPDDDGLSFDDFGGYQEVISRAKELIETQFERREELRKIGARPVRGILFTGPPGTGKTHLARIIANQSNANFYDISGPAIVSKWVGDSENLLRRIFEHADKSPSGKSIIFFDEIDSIAESRSGDTHEASRKLVAQFLTLMDGFSNSQNTTIVIAATNRVEALDSALTRPGRFDWEIEFGLPTVLDRIEILKVDARRINCGDDLPISEVAIRTHNWSAARLSSIWTEAALIAAADKRNRVVGEDFAQAFERVARRPERSQQKEKR